MHCSNAGLLALWLILCTQGHEDFNLSSWHCRRVRVCFTFLPVCVCVCTRLCAQHVYAHAFICVFSLISPLYFHQITNSNELPLAIIAHFSADPTRWGGRVWHFVPLYASKWGGKIIKMCKNKHKMFIVA